ncbi:hypothetical protein XAP3CFBP6996_008165 [Xanthomonas citri pv. fuscans CFBP 6996]|uniref:Antitoxin VbhA domain-containing protein n=1 Tax=Xanthomonas citri pv. phaseoli var. fuscans TaxID=473423 RepID=A0AB33F6P4_XANCI|nr:hypothetical protein XAP3CFBP6996_008165 [Xanthomonas citri pv. fuscans CFBP 6996]QWN15831.1 hypothetical protein DGN02_08180 [Xanthomonas citri]QWN20172.1 hypothetical protein DGM98_08445 [Xanthomonas citri]
MPPAVHLTATPLDQQEIQTRQEHVETWIAQQNAAGFGVDQHMADALNAYLDGRFDLLGLLTELRRPYLN